MPVQFSDGMESGIAIDSGAEENVCPWEWGQQFEISNSKVHMNLVTASGDHVPHDGERVVFVSSLF